MSQPYAEAMDMIPAVSYIPYATYTREQTSKIITFTHFEEGDLLSETRNVFYETRDDTKSRNEYDEIKLCHH